MKTSCFAAALLLCGFAASASAVRGQDLLLKASYSTNLDNTWNFQVPCYLIQVQYLVVPPYHGGYGYGGYYGSRRYYTWITVAESDDLAEATFIYELYKLAEEQFVLDEVAPEIPHAYPLSVRMITEYHSPELSAW